MKLIGTAAVAAMVGNAEATLTWGGKCRVPGTDYTTQPNLDISRYLGRWYEIQRDKDTEFEWTGSCNTATYSSSDIAGGKVTVKNRMWVWWWFFTYNDANGKAQCKSDGKCNVTFSGDPKPIEDGKLSNYNVLSTDYDSYSLVYTCSEKWFGLAVKEYFWILSRQPTMSEAKLRELRTLMNTKVPGYDHSKSGLLTSHEKCEYI